MCFYPEIETRVNGQFCVDVHKLQKMNINQEHLKKLISDCKKESEELKDVINPILEKNTLPQKEILEVCQVAKFSKNIDESIRKNGFARKPL